VDQGRGAHQGRTLKVKGTRGSRSKGSLFDLSRLENPTDRAFGAIRTEGPSVHRRVEMPP